MLEKIILKAEHKLNPLHVYCRIRDYKMSVSYAKRFVKIYERMIFKPIIKVVYEVMKK